MHCSVRFFICGMALKFSANIYYEEASLFKKSKYLWHCHLNDLLSFTLKPEVETSLERINVKNGQIELYCAWSNMVT